MIYGPRRAKIVVASVIPSDIANLYAWYKGDAGLPDNPVDVWQNQSSAGVRNLMQPTSTNQPVTDATTMGAQSVKFDGSATSLTSVGSTFTFTDCTIYIVFRPVTLSVQQCLAGLTSVQQSGLGFNTDGTPFMADATTTTNGTGNATVNTNHVYVFSRTGSTGSVSLDRGAATTGSFTSTVNRLAVGSKRSFLLPTSAYIGEVLAYSSALSGANNTSLLNYLSAKWSTP